MRAAVAFAALALVACKKDRDAPGSKPLDEPQALALPAKAVPAGSLVQPPFFTDFTVVVPAGTDPELGVRAVREAARARGLDVGAFADTPPGGRGALVGVDTPVGGGVPLLELEHIGTGLAPDDLTAMRAAKQAIRVGTFGADDAARTLRDGLALARAAGGATNGWIYDGHVPHVFSRAAFDAAFPDDVAMSAPKLVTVTYERGDAGMFRLESSGLQRLGLPEVRVERVPGALMRDVGILLTAAAQTLIDQGGLATDAEIAIDLGSFAVAPWPDRAKEARDKGGTGRLTWAAHWVAEPSSFDVARTIELSLPGPGAEGERLYAALERALGAYSTAIDYYEADDAELLAAGARAREALATLKPTFTEGVPHGERLIVKAPFATDDGGREWMWVDVQTWKGDTIAGMLLNQPDLIADLDAGERVQVKVSELADYLHTRRDGSVAGGESVEILRRRDAAQ